MQLIIFLIFWLCTNLYHMLPIKPILLLLCVLVSTHLFAQTILKSAPVQISGTVSNYAKHKATANSVQIIINDLATGDQLTYRGKINDDGKYQVAFPKTGPQDVMFMYDENIERILVSPGDRMVINFNADNLEKSISFKGDDEHANQDFKGYQRAELAYWSSIYGHDEYNRYRALAASEKDKMPDVHQKYLKDRFKKDSIFLKNYLGEHKVTPLFRSWALADLKYEYLNNLMRYTWMHYRANKMKREEFLIPEAYYAFATNDNLNDVSAAMSSNFGDYVKEYASYVTSKRFGAKYLINDEMMFNFDQPPGLFKDVTLCNKFYLFIKAKNLDLLAPYMDRFAANVGQPALKQTIINAYTEAVEKQKNLALPAQAHINAAPATEADSIFNKIVSKYAGKVVYVDFWGTWCAPCRAQMPSAAKLHDQYTGKDVVFLYLGVLSEPKAWKAMIADLKIKGEHYLLKNNDYNAIAAKFHIGGIPRYLLINQRGQVVFEDAKRPGDALLKDDINALLAAK